MPEARRGLDSQLGLEELNWVVSPHGALHALETSSAGR